jgi:hypothetical protein
MPLRASGWGDSLEWAKSEGFCEYSGEPTGSIAAGMLSMQYLEVL